MAPKDGTGRLPCLRDARRASRRFEVSFREKEEVMSKKRTIEVFSAGCAVCQDTIDLVNSIACPSCEVTVLEIKDPAVAQRARTLGIRTPLCRR